ncbi:MAG: exodeoxyribonuclease VII large subunit [Bacteroidia bacterium]|nr:exodeoxyribonuclease VII large subunit [Bacteroidia bacterium]
MQSINLSQLLYKIDETLQSQFGYQTFWIKAEITDVKKYESKRWCFLKLIEKKDEQIIAEMKATAWSQGYVFIEQFERLTQQTFTNGLQIVCKVKVKYSIKYGLSFDVLEIDNSFALGQIELQKQATLKRLVDESNGQIIKDEEQYFTPNKRLKLPIVIQKIALITAHNSDGQRDFKNELLNNNYGYAFKVDEYLCQIQGDNAHENIIKQFEQIFASNIQYDCVAMVRGGGSETDFKPFEQYELAKLVAFYHIPVFTGIGHDRNTSIVDLMARQLKTPTKVAAHIVDHNFMFENNLLYQFNQIAQTSALKIDRAKQNLVNLKRLLQSLDPENVLKKGYALVKLNNKIVSNANQLKAGDEVETFIKDTKIVSVVSEVQ